MIELPEEYDELLVLEPRDFFDQFIVGVVERFNDTFVIYDREAMLEAMVVSWQQDGTIDEDDDQDPMTTALEHYNFNMRGGWVGESTPGYIILRREANPDDR